MKNIKTIPEDMRKIIDIANALSSRGRSSGSTGEVIAAAFVLNRMEFLPEGYAVIDAWERLDKRWQKYVKIIRAEFSELLVPW